jgi:gluconolactonase
MHGSASRRGSPADRSPQRDSARATARLPSTREHRTPRLAEHDSLVDIGSVEQIWAGIDHAEGLAVAADGTIWCGGEEGQVYRGQVEGSPQNVATLRGRTLGFAVDGDGNAYCADPDGPGLYRITPGGEVAEVSNGSVDRPAIYPNHPAFLPSGEILWTDSGNWGADNGCLFMTSPGGSTKIADRSACRFPNGLAVSPDRRTLAVVESALPGVASLSIDGTTLHGYRVLVELPDTVPDGVAFDADGGLLISCWAPDAILVLRAGGELETVAYDPLRFAFDQPTNIAFLPDSRKVVVANFGERFLSVFEHDCLGAPVPRPTSLAFSSNPGHRTANPSTPVASEPDSREPPV